MPMHPVLLLDLPGPRGKNINALIQPTICILEFSHHLPVENIPLWFPACEAINPLQEINPPLPSGKYSSNAINVALIVRMAVT